MLKQEEAEKAQPKDFTLLKLQKGAAPKKGKGRAPAKKKGKKKKGGARSEDDEIGSDDSLNEFIAADDDEIEYVKKKPKGRK